MTKQTRPARRIHATVDDYIADQAEEMRERLTAVRTVVHKAVPRAVEGIGYGMPAYKLAGKPLVYFAVFTRHIGLFAIPTTHRALDGELSRYKRGKGSVQFPHDEALPLDLIRRMVEMRAAQIRELAAAPPRKSARKATTVAARKSG